MPNASVKRFRRLPDDEQSRVIEMAWEDRTPFEAIETLFGLSEPDVIDVMRRRVTGSVTKHRALRSPSVLRGYCPTQYKR